MTNLTTRTPKKEAFKPHDPLVISQQMNDILIGTLLDDGSMGSLPAEQTWNSWVLHGEDQKLDLFHKYEIMKDFCSKGPAQQQVENKVGKKLTRWYFNTRRMGIFQYYGRLFYTLGNSPNKAWIKRVSPTIEDLLNLRVLAYSYMDDGDQKWRGHSRAGWISVNNFIVENYELLQTALEKKYGLVTTL